MSLGLGEMDAAVNDTSQVTVVVLCGIITLHYNEMISQAHD